MKKLVEMETLHHQEKLWFRHVSWEKLNIICKGLRLRIAFSQEATQAIQSMFAMDLEEEMNELFFDGFISGQTSRRISALVEHNIIEAYKAKVDL